MANIPLRDFPLEDHHGPWPLLKATQEDLRYMPTSKPAQAPQPQQPQQAQTKASSYFLDLVSPALKGAIVGLLAFGLTYSFLPLQTFWLSSWHWAYVVGGVILLIILVGLDITFIAVFVASLLLSLWLNWRMLITHPLILLLFLGGGVIILYLRELLPRKTS